MMLAKIDCCKCKKEDLKDDDQHFPLYLAIELKREDYVICNECYDKTFTE